MSPRSKPVELFAEHSLAGNTFQRLMPASGPSEITSSRSQFKLLSTVNVEPMNMDISGDRVQPDVVKQELYDFANVSTDNVKSLNVLDNHNNNNNGLEPKEANNNHVTLDMSSYCSDLWPTIDSSVLEELNSWSQAQGVKGDNTDGTIYTLTVLNGVDHNPWFKGDDKDHKITNSSLDLDSLLNVIPPNFESGYSTEIKSDYTFDDSGFEEKKEACGSLTSCTSFHNNNNNSNNNNNNNNGSSNNNNNNEWKQENNEAESLLRSALTGKSIVRYNGKKEPETKQEEEEKMIIEIETPMLYDAPSLIDSDNPSSAQSMEDLFLNPLHNYPDDYEKLKRIENEVVKSVEQFCLDRTYSPSSSNSLVPSNLQHSNSKSVKKQPKRVKTASTTGTTTTTPRKERSLHYCTICNKGFKDKYSVNVHIRTHTGEKPFNCSMCGKSFRQKAHLAKHYQTHFAQAKNGGLPASSKAAKNLISSS